MAQAAIRLLRPDSRLGDWDIDVSNGETDHNRYDAILTSSGYPEERLDHANDFMTLSNRSRHLRTKAQSSVPSTQKKYGADGAPGHEAGAGANASIVA
jgi:hypothetical protein